MFAAQQREKDDSTTVIRAWWTLNIAQLFARWKRAKRRRGAVGKRTCRRRACGGAWDHAIRHPASSRTVLLRVNMSCAERGFAPHHTISRRQMLHAAETHRRFNSYRRFTRCDVFLCYRTPRDGSPVCFQCGRCGARAPQNLRAVI